MSTKRMTKDAARGYLVTKERARNQLFVDPRESPFFAGHQYGLFTWTKEYVTFEFYGNGYLRTLRVKMADVKRANEPDNAEMSWSFAPDKRDAKSWAVTDGMLTETPGTQHIALQSPKWERSAWNTLNAWCLPLGVDRTGGVGRRLDQVPLLHVAALAEAAWARISYASHTTYFLPDPSGDPAGMVAPGTQYPAYYAVRVAMSSTRALIEGPNYFQLRSASPAELEYLAVAWDEYSGTGKPSSTLRGLPSSGRITSKQLDYALAKLGNKVKSCGITKTALREGMKIELEHRDVTRGGIEKTARIAAAHLCERKDYYTRLKRYVERS